MTKLLIDKATPKFQAEITYINVCTLTEKNPDIVLI